MSASSSSCETDLRCSYSISQLLHATKRKLQDTVFSGRINTIATQVEVNTLEKDALEVLSLVRSVKNSFAPVNRIPPDVLSLIPDYRDDSEDGSDQDLITLTHVCRSWRDTFTSRSSLWTRLDFTNIDKTCTYIRRSKSSPLEIYLERNKISLYLDCAFYLLVPCIHRIKSLIIHANTLPDAVGHFHRHAPLLEELNISLNCPNAPVLDSALFNGDLSSLRKLSLRGVITRLPWKNLANLTTFNFKSCRPGYDIVTLLLDFFENAPFLHAIRLEDSIPKSSDAPSGRILPLPHLGSLAIIGKLAPSILLKHLRIPTGASLTLAFGFGVTNPRFETTSQEPPSISETSLISR